MYTTGLLKAQVSNSVMGEYVANQFIPVEWTKQGKAGKNFHLPMVGHEGIRGENQFDIGGSCFPVLT